MAVITISRQYGSGGDEIAAQVCRMIGYRLFDQQMVLRAGAEAGLSSQEAVDYSEENYRLQGFFDRLYGRTRQAAQAWTWVDESPRTRIDLPLAEETAIWLVRRAVHSAYKAGNLVILGRGGQMLLRDCTDVLHVRVEAPLEERIQTVREKLLETGPDDRDMIEARRAARELIDSRDEAAADYLKRYYGVDWADPLLYHVVINTGRVEIEQAAQAIVELAMRLPVVTAREQNKKVSWQLV
jgi:cytidylate kinase